MASRERSARARTNGTNGNGARHPAPAVSRTPARRKNSAAPRFAPGVATDDVRSAWDQVAASEEHFRTLLEFASDAIAVIGEHGTIVYASQATTRILGYSTEEFVGKSAFDLVHPDDLERTELLFAECLGSPGVPIRAEYRARHKDGTWRELEGIGVNRLGHPGIRGIVASYRDVSERKQSQVAILHLASIVETSGNAIIGLDANGRIESWNSSAERLYGYEPGEVLGRSLEIVFPLERSRDSTELVKQVRDGTGVANYESIGLRKNGERVPISVTISPIRNLSAGVTGASAIVWDVSERKRTEQELQRAKEAAEAANRAKSDFVANVSHEIRTPLNGIIGMIELTLQTALTPEQVRFLHTARMASDSLLEVINDILDLSKVEAGKYETVSMEFSLRDCISDTVRALAYVANQKGIHLDCRFDPEVPDGLVGDRGRLRQIVLNLAGNAVKFTDVGEVAVGVTVEERRNGNVKLHFTVKDTGIGIPHEKRSVIFQAFTQGDSSNTRKHSGTGLGLTIAAQLAKSAGGRIWVESEVGVGSTFHFTATFALSQRSEDATSARRHVALSELRPLIVQADGPECRGLVAMFAGWRIIADVAPDGPFALHMLESARRRGEPYNLVLAQAEIPGQDGYELADEIHAQDDLGPPVILMTAGMPHSKGTAGGGITVAAYLARPIGPSQLLNAIDMVWKRKSSDAASDAPTPERKDLKRPLRILSVEDNAFNQMFVSSLLEQDGHSVDLAATGYEALEALERESFDLVLMDVQMPEMDGIQAAGVIREREKKTGGRIPIVAMTARAMIGDRERCLAAGMDGYLSKPVHSEELRRLVDRVGSMGQAAPQPPPSDPGDRGVEHRVIPDLKALLRKVEGDVSLLTRMAGIFRDQSRRLLGDLNAAIERGDAAGVNEAAHALKGSLAFWCQGSAFQIARRLEAKGRTRDLEGAREDGERLAEEYGRLEGELMTVLKQTQDEEESSCLPEPS
ncbi:MAG TPA: PAS domain S-box protein [Candidatus Limnocylindrales bacterium]|nr:PAS domain S-box protein [Candidatus Limnocylindrales bacterium]